MMGRNEIVIKDEYLGFNYMVKHYDLTDNTEHGNIDNSYSLDYIRTTDWYCGYVEIPRGHKYYEVDYHNIYGKNGEFIDVHGGLNFSDRFEENGAWYIGFHCHHLYDNSIEQDANYAEEQCRYLIEQLKKLEVE